MPDPLLLPLAGVIAGILLGRGLEFHVQEAVAASSALALLAAAARIKAGRLLAAAATLLTFLFVGAALEAWHRPGPPPELDAGPRETVLLEGCVVEPTVFSADREQFTLELGADARARVSLALEDGDAGDPLRYGQKVRIEARARPPHNFNNPGGFDYTGYLSRQKIFWTASMTRGSRARILPGRCGSRIMAGIFALRTAAIERIEALYPDGGLYPEGERNPESEYLAGMMEGVLIGETSKLDRAWTENFRRTGTFHALVISGVHVTVLAGVLLFLLRLTAMPEMAALTVTATAAWLYAMVSGFSAPVVRAAGGFTLYLIARFFFRRARVLNLLAAVALVYLAWDPDQLFDASFQLSFLSVAAIGALAAPLVEATMGPLARGLRHISTVDADPHLDPRVAQFRVEVRLAAETLHLWTRVPLRWAREGLALFLRLALFGMEMAAISAVIQIGLALPMAEYLHRVSFTGLTANLLIVPALDAVIPIGFAAVFTGWHWIAAVAGGILRFAAKVADWHAHLEPAWRVPDPPSWLALSFVGSLLLLALLARTSTCRAGPARGAGEILRKFARWPAAAAVLGLFALLLWQPGQARAQPGTMELTAIDVGQGDSLLLVLPSGQTVLVDAGGLLQFGRVRKSNLDIGEDVVSPYLWSRGIRRIDLVAATHAHQDHIGGLASVLANFRPRELWIGANFPPEIGEQARRLGIRTIEPRAGPPFDLGGARFEILSPPGDYEPVKPGSPANNDSLALRVTFGARSFLLTGDMEKPMEARLLLAQPDPAAASAETPGGLGAGFHADVLKVGHHGSKTSTIQPFLDAVSPSIALISAGYENSFGHPHPDVVARLEARHAAILRTDRNGLATVRTDGTRLWFEVQSWRPSRPFEGAARLPAVTDLLH